MAGVKVRFKMNNNEIRTDYINLTLILSFATLCIAQTFHVSSVFCKTFLHKIAKTFCRSLQLHFVGNCKPGWQSWYLPAI